MVVLVVVVAHRLVSTAQEVLQVSARLLFIVQYILFLFCVFIEHFQFLFYVTRQGLSAVPQVNCCSKTALLDATSLPSTLAPPSRSVPSISTTLPPRPYTHTARPRELDTLCDLGLQCLAEFFALTLNWLLADSISSAYRHITRALQILPPGCMSSGRRMPFQPRPGRIGRECLQVLCKGWTTSFLSHHFNSEREFPLGDGE